MKATTWHEGYLPGHGNGFSLSRGDSPYSRRLSWQRLYLKRADVAKTFHKVGLQGKHRVSTGCMQQNQSERFDRVPGPHLGSWTGPGCPAAHHY